MAIVYINGNTIILENSSQATQEEISQITDNKTQLTQSEKIVLNKINDKDTENMKNNRKRKKPKQPNPLRYTLLSTVNCN